MSSLSEPKSSAVSRVDEEPKATGNLHHDVKYCIVTSIRDEEEFIAGTIESVASQTVLPVEWIIVNDGSMDRTGTIIDDYSRKYPWIRPLHRVNRGFRSTGGGIEGFITGTESLQFDDWDFLVNLDGDVTFAPDYFQKCFENFGRNPRLGIGGGTIYNKIGDRLELERVPTFHVRGATKIYRRPCWQQLGGMLAGLGWDTVDEVRANMLGWSTQSFAELPIIHHRVTGTAGGMWWGLVKDGKADYIVGYHPLFFAAKCLRRLFKPPYVIGTFGLCYGFLRASFQRVPRVKDPQFIRYIRRQQLNRLFGLQTIWK